MDDKFLKNKRTPVLTEVPLGVVRELARPDFSGILSYGAECIRRCAKLTHGEDPGETRVLRANMRDHARRLSTLARSVRRNAND